MRRSDCSGDIFQILWALWRRIAAHNLPGTDVPMPLRTTPVSPLFSAYAQRVLRRARSAPGRETGCFQPIIGGARAS